MNYSYQIVTNELCQKSSNQRQFVAHLTNIRIEIDGNHIESPYPNKHFEGETYVSAMLMANDAFKSWIMKFARIHKVER